MRRYIKDCKENNIELQEIKTGLERDIYGFETDSKHHTTCIDNLNRIAKQSGINDIKWNIKCEDSLRADTDNMFDFVVGNPPYIKYKSLKAEDRTYVKENFETCTKGKFDYCYAFIEKSLKSLKTGGKMTYLLPSSIFKNVFAESLREYMLPHLIEIYDYTTQKVFTKETGQDRLRLTSTTIIVLEKDSNTKQIIYNDVANNRSREINKNSLKGKWIFNKEESKKNKIRFGDYFKASNTIATLYNEAFLIKNIESENQEYIITKERI